METPDTSALPLTPEALEQLVLHGKLKELVDAVKPLSEKERKKLSKTAYSLYKLAKNKWDHLILTPYQDKQASKIHAFNRESVYKKAQCAILAVCPLSRVKDINHWIYTVKVKPHVIEILSDRKPAWLDQWIQYRLENNTSIYLWEFIRAL